MHLKQHYEPQMDLDHMSRKHGSDCETNEAMIIDGRQNQVAENLIEGLEDSQGNIKDERENLPEIDEFNEFSEPEEDMMEDLRKEVDKVVETIGDNACLSEGNWNYHVTDEIEDDQVVENHGDLQLYSGNLNSNYEEIDNEEPQPELQVNSESRHFESEDEEEDLPLEQVRRSLQRPAKGESDFKKPVNDDDREDVELTECLKKIHNFKCTIHPCNKAFNSRTALGYHLKTHTTERRFVCDQVKFLIDILLSTF